MISATAARAVVTSAVVTGAVVAGPVVASSLVGRRSRLAGVIPGGVLRVIRTIAAVVRPTLTLALTARLVGETGRAADGHDGTRTLDIGLRGSVAHVRQDDGDVRKDDGAGGDDPHGPSAHENEEHDTNDADAHSNRVLDHPAASVVFGRRRQGRDGLRFHIRQAYVFPSPKLVRILRGEADLKAIRRNDLMATARTVLISGGNRGIGYAIAEEFIAQGHRVAVTARSGEGPAGSMTVRADVTDQASVDAAFAEVEAELGAVEVVVANAGITKDTLLMRMTAEDFDAVVDTNLGGSFRLVKRASKGMLKAKYGRIVLISSVVGLYGSAGQVNYAASKSGLVGMARSITRELGGRGITANVVAPGFIETDMTAELPEATQADYKKSIPAGRFATANEVAKVVAWIASDDAAYISGAVIPVDGGLGMGH